MKIRRARFRLPRGVHPLGHKEPTASRAIEIMPVPKTLLVALNQHIGQPSKPVVKKGDVVLRGQPLAEPAGYVSSWVHAPTSGTVKSLEMRPTASGHLGSVVELEADGRDQSVAPAPLSDWSTRPSRELVNQVLAAGVIGMGGAGFPTQVKLLPPPGKSIQTLIINGAECEPFLTADQRLMVEQAGRIWQGICMLRRILGATQVRVAVEDNKMEAVASMAEAMKDADGDVELVVVETKYPQGAEKQLIYTCTRREVPTGGLPMDIGTLVENVGTAAAVHDAIAMGLPLTERVVTVTGDAVTSPKNVRARIGTPLGDMIAYGGGFAGAIGKVVCGGPMMGIAQDSLNVGINKTTSGLLLLPRSQVHQFSSTPCISCGRCVAACPAGLLPCVLSENLEAENYAEAEALNVLDCIECGACAFECPAHRPLVQHMRQGKANVLKLRKQRDSRREVKVKPA